MIEKALSGDVRAMARLISEVENETARSEKIMREIYPHTGKAHIIGVTGSPGSGKSSLVNRMIASFRGQGKTVGIIAVDPSSPFSGGAILADRIRMQEHSGDPDVYIRSMGSRGSLGGLSKSTYEGALILDACGKDIVIVETVGVGQSEIDVVKIADTVCLVLVPGMGDDMQIMKAGIMEIADLFVINKSDRDGADKVAAEVQLMLKMFHDGTGWYQPVTLTSAETGSGLEELSDTIERHRRYLETSEEGELRLKRRLQWEVEEIVRRRIAKATELAWDRRQEESVLENLYRKETDPYRVAQDVLVSALDEVRSGQYV
ncbi:LAO/AO transport system ATPase [Dethiosulfovibrio peptidovorans DSM 11002]|uniref:LAO/AO transport system ATPase n=1 Tax=Dethiosulfovibrio peptidovorans DSM 11002 TaxID=469381 RepID=D2Z3G3_9BACT|nr:methylmalonyl Co-A mutase-associated GTPase MeaB [Dethiosulfovibrio peptidovorans]EFC92203.1 LAO/AO transport system ATPase [Dethiosulfovibrio peptidovorans DSM 11002]